MSLKTDELRLVRHIDDNFFACTCQLCLSTMRLTDFDYSHEFLMQELQSYSLKPLTPVSAGTNNKSSSAPFDYIRLTKIQTTVLRAYFAHLPYLTHLQAELLHEKLMDSKIININISVQRLKGFWRNERHRSSKKRK